MGYYDDHYNEGYRQKKPKRTGYFLAGLAGVLIGALLVAFILPSTSILNRYGSDTGKESSIQQKVAYNVNSSVTEAFDKAADAVVGITNIQEASLFNQGGETGTGSGVVYKIKDGRAYIITNHHVIDGANRLEVSLSDGTKVPAKILGSDVWTDLAVISIDGRKVKTTAEFGNSDTLKPGEPAIAIGNPLGLQFSGSVTEGIISGLNRTIEIDINNDGIVDWNADVIQTDAAINPGNSGGALVNIKGQLVGINSMKIAQNEVEGIGLAIPINSVIPIIEDIEQFGEVKRPYLGVSLVPIAEVTQFHRENTFHLPATVKEGVAVVDVEKSSPAAKAGMKPYDVIIEMDGEKITDMASFRTHLYEQKKIGDKMKVTIYRDGRTIDMEVVLQGGTF
ncbi:S1C family serine protease [Bacillus sp. 1P06AnD]|uniref:S1C family serine protease n=1 Tax=Bacillus sp. 1P06AnD TaxID=3132208 RepID=UPI0039A320C0